MFVVRVLDAILDFFARGESLNSSVDIHHSNFLDAVGIATPQPRCVVFCLNRCRHLIEFLLVSAARLQPNFVASRLYCALSCRYRFFQISYLGDLGSVPCVDSSL